MTHFNLTTLWGATALTALLTLPACAGQMASLMEDTADPVAVVTPVQGVSRTRLERHAVPVVTTLKADDGAIVQTTTTNEESETIMATDPATAAYQNQATASVDAMVATNQNAPASPLMSLQDEADLAVTSDDIVQPAWMN